MKRKILYILIVIAVLLFVGCIIVLNIKKKEEKEIVVDEIEHKIVFIISKMSYSEGYDHRGYFIDNCGYRYYYNLSDYEDYYSEDVYYEYLTEHMEDYDKEPYLEKEQLYEAYKHLLMIDENAKIKEGCTGSTHAGSFCYFGVRPGKDGQMEIVLLEEYGDWETTNLDKNVDDIMKIIGRDNWKSDIWERSKHHTE